MIKKIWAIFLRDIKVNIRDFLAVVIIAFPILFAIGINLLTPSINDTTVNLALIEGENPAQVSYLKDFGKSIIGALLPIYGTAVLVWITGFGNINILQILVIVFVSTIISLLVGFIEGLNNDDIINATGNIKMLMLPMAASVAAIELLGDKWQMFFYWIPFYWAYKGNDAVLTGSAMWQQILLYSVIVLGLSGIVYVYLAPKAGDHLIAASTIYGGTYNLFAVTLKKLGIEVTFIEPEADYDEIVAAANKNTKAIFAETIGNPGLNILDFEKFSTAAKAMDVPFIVDNTLATAILCRPFEQGADIVIHSATKYTDGHATSVGGVIIDGGTFNWDNGKYPELVESDPSYHGIQYVKDFGNAAYITKARVQLLRDFGTTMSPFSAFLFHLGLETLHVRMERHCENALKLATFLSTHPGVNWVNYPLLKGHKT